MKTGTLAFALLTLFGCGNATEFREAQRARRIFVTSETMKGDRFSWQEPGGARPFGEAQCVKSAREGGLGDNWVPWLSSHDAWPINAIDLIKNDGPWYDLRGRLVFADKAEITGKGPRVALSIDESGNELPSGKPIWTGTQYTGIASLDKCFDRAAYRVWYADTNDVFGLVGETGVTTPRWTDSHPLGCAEQAHLICFER